MYRLDEDMSSADDMIKAILLEANLAADVNMLIMDISYIKNFNSDILHTIFSKYVDIKLIDEFTRGFDKVFLDVCLSAILQYKKDIEVMDLCIYIIELLEKVLTSMRIYINLPINIVNELLLFIDILRNNINYTIELVTGNECTRIGVDNINYIDYNFYTVCDFTNLFCNSISGKHTLYIKRYEIKGVEDETFLK